MTTPFARVMLITGCKTQSALALLLGIRQSSVSAAKKSGVIPAEWLLTLLRSRRINPDWIVAGQGPEFLPHVLPSGKPASAPTPMPEDILRGFTAEDLIRELLRRIQSGEISKEKKRASTKEPERH